MTDIFDDRRKGLEEEYFHRQNKEAIEKLRRLAVSEQAKAAGTSSMKCPRCDGKLEESKVDEVTIDTCDKCGGVWLDSGELEQLTKRESGGWFSRLRNR